MSDKKSEDTCVKEKSTNSVIKCFIKYIGEMDKSLLINFSVLIIALFIAKDVVEQIKEASIQKYELISVTCFSEALKDETIFTMYCQKESEESYGVYTRQDDGSIKFEKYNCEITLIKQDGGQKTYAEVSRDLSGNVKEVILHVPEELEILGR